MNRRTQPEIRPIENLAICCPESITMENGIELKYIKTDYTEIVRIDFMFKGGQWTQEIPLQAYYAFKQLKEGTQSFKGEDIAERLDFYGATIEVASSMSYSAITLLCLRRHLKHIIPIIQSILWEPTYNQEKLSISLAQGKAMYAASLQNVETRCKQLFYKSVYGERHPMAQYPSLQDYDTLTPEALQQFSNNNISSNNCQIFFTGKYDEKNIHIITEAFGKSHWGGNGEKFAGYRFFETNSSKQNRYYSHMEDMTVQSAIKIGRIFPERHHKDFAKLHLTNVILGGYFGSRLMSNIRESKGYTYDINSAIYQSPQNTTFVVSTEAPNEYTDCIIEEVHKEMYRLGKEPVSYEELANVKSYLSGTLCRYYETGLNTSTMLMRLETTNRTPLDVVRDFEEMKKITPQDIMECASAYLSRKSMTECIAGYF